jgi:hypothetical protein
MLPPDEDEIAEYNERLVSRFTVAAAYAFEEKFGHRALTDEEMEWCRQKALLLWNAYLADDQGNFEQNEARLNELLFSDSLGEF